MLARIVGVGPYRVYGRIPHPAHRRNEKVRERARYLEFSCLCGSRGGSRGPGRLRSHATRGLQPASRSGSQRSSHCPVPVRLANRSDRRGWRRRRAGSGPADRLGPEVEGRQTLVLEPARDRAAGRRAGRTSRCRPGAQGHPARGRGRPRGTGPRRRARTRSVRARGAERVQAASGRLREPGVPRPPDRARRPSRRGRRRLRDLQRGDLGVGLGSRTARSRSDRRSAARRAARRRAAIRAQPVAQLDRYGRDHGRHVPEDLERVEGRRRLALGSAQVGLQTVRVAAVAVAIGAERVEDRAGVAVAEQQDRSGADRGRERGSP